jgi:hypothetical protein
MPDTDARTSRMLDYISDGGTERDLLLAQADYCPACMWIKAFSLPQHPPETCEHCGRDGLRTQPY